MALSRASLALALDGVAHDPGQPPSLDLPLEEVILSARSDRLERDGFVIQPGDHDDRLVDRAPPPAHALEGFESLAVGQPEVQEDDVHGRAVQLGEGGFQTVHLLQIELVRRLAQHLHDEPGVPGVVLDQENLDRAGHGRDSFTISSQNCSMEPTTLRNCSRSTGFVT